MRLPTGLCLCSWAHSFSPPPRVCPAVSVSVLDVYTAGAESSNWATRASNQSPFGEFHWPRFSWTWDSWKSFSCHVGLSKILVEATEGLLGLDILSYSSLNSCCGYKSASLGWEALSTALAPGHHVAEFKVSGPVVLPPSLFLLFLWLPQRSVWLL